MPHTEIDDFGGIPVARRGIPGWLISVAVVVLTVAGWYLLSFSSTDYSGTYPKPEVDLVLPGGAPVEAEH
jgi:hypothetical protein